MPLTNVKCRNAKGKTKPHKLSDGGGLHLLVNPDGAMRVYPGSPEIAAYSMRDTDRMIANELHPEDANTLARLFHGDEATRRGVRHMDVASETAMRWIEPLPLPPLRHGK